MNSLKEQEILMVENEYWVTMNNALEKLKQNKDFQTVILDGYFKDKAINVSLLAQDAIVESGRRSSVMEDLIAISSLEDYFITIENLGTIPPEEEEED